MPFRDIDPTGIAVRTFYTFDKEWALLSAGSNDSFNTMTVSWGTTGTLWNLPVTTVYCRPQRYTREFMDRESYYTLSFFGGQQMEQLGYLGSNSGRDKNKVAHTGLTPVFDDQFNTPYFDEAHLVIICRKLYRNILDADCFFDSSIAAAHYPHADFHHQYIGEVVRMLLRD